MQASLKCHPIFSPAAIPEVVWRGLEYRATVKVSRECEETRERKSALQLCSLMAVLVALPLTRSASASPFISIENGFIYERQKTQAFVTWEAWQWWNGQRRERNSWVCL